MALETPVPRTAATGDQATLVAGVALFSEEPAELADFYSKVLRITFRGVAHDDGRRHWIASANGVQIEVKALRTSSGELAKDATGSEIVGGVSRAELSFQVARVAGTVARAVTNGGQLVAKAEQFSWGTFAVVIDPDGNRIGLFEPTSDNTEGQAS